METPKTIRFAGPVALIICLTAGCVGPGPQDQSVVGRYWRYLVDRGPQKRQAEADLGLLEPVPVEGAPKLKLETIKTPDGKEKTILHLSLDEALRLALSNNPEIRVVSYDPAISRQDMVKAAAEFDYVVFGSVSYDKTDKRTVSTILPGGQSYEKAFSVGLKQTTITGAEWSLAWTMTRAWDNPQFYSVQPRYEPVIALEITQPLLRGGWPEFKLANLRLSRVNYNINAAGFRQKLEEAITKVISAYWQYVQAREDYEIQRRLLDETIETKRKVAARAAEGLAPQLQVDQIDANVAARRANLISAQKALVDARDLLAARLADARVNVLTEYEIVPATPLSDARLMMDVKDQLLTALRYNPLLEQARLAIEAGAINVRIAENQALPKLDLTASTSFQGLAGQSHESLEMLNTGEYASYGIALSLEYPLGNRERMAELQRSRLLRYKAVATMQNIADQVAVGVRERIRQVNATFDQIKAFEDGIKAAKAYRDKLEITVSQELGKAMTPERLQLLLSAQELVATQERGRLQALTEYNVALVDLARTQGTVLELNRVRVALPAVEAEEAAQPPSK
jgi:outer membrane protein TolC